MHLSAFSKDLKKLSESRLILSQSQEVLDEIVLSWEEHSATSLKQEGLVRWDKGRLPSTQGLLRISSTTGTAYRGFRGKEQGDLP
jgi:hypothetical protein